jgi:flagellar biosynthesis protein FlhA
MQKTSRIAQLGIPGAVVAVVVMMVVPLPTVVLDLLLALNITGSLVILLSAMYVKKPLELSVFPSLLLVATMFRLSLNVSATRQVLLHANAGRVIDAFGKVVIGGSIVVGLVVFFILVVIQFLVITKGSERVAEVAARFTLDALPGKQMAIDADLNSGLIDEDEARRRRREVSMEADFYGAMDGASKFVKGDAIASIVITTVNLFGGFVVGVLQHGMSLNESISTYSLLSVGDGLVSQVPALLISVSTGLIVTRAATDKDMGTDLYQQIGAQRQALTLGSCAMGLLALLPGMPKVPFLVVGVAGFALSRRAGTRDGVDRADAAAALVAAPQASPDSPEAIAAGLRVEPIELELSFDLVDLVDQARGGDLLDRVKALRRKLATDLGIVLPLVRTRDNIDLPPSTYAVRIHGVELARGSAPAGCVLVIGDDLGGMPGTPTVEPVWGLPAVWVPIEARPQAEAMGHTVVDRSSVLTTHLSEVVRVNAGRILSRSDVKALVDLVKGTDPVVIEELTTAGITLAELQKVLRDLLDEGIAIRDLVRIFEAIGEKARASRDPEALCEAARIALGPAISTSLAIGGRLPILTLDPLLEQRLLEALRMPGTGFTSEGTALALDGASAERLALESARLFDVAEQRGDTPALVCGAALRPAVKRLVHAAAPRLAVLSYLELAPSLALDTVGVVTLAEHATV